MQEKNNLLNCFSCKVFLLQIEQIKFSSYKHLQKIKNKEILVAWLLTRILQKKGYKFQYTGNMTFEIYDSPWTFDHTALFANFNLPDGEQTEKSFIWKNMTYTPPKFSFVPLSFSPYYFENIWKNIKRN